MSLDTSLLFLVDWCPLNQFVKDLFLSNDLTHSIDLPPSKDLEVPFACFRIVLVLLDMATLTWETYVLFGPNPFEGDLGKLSAPPID